MPRGKGATARAFTLRTVEAAESAHIYAHHARTRSIFGGLIDSCDRCGTDLTAPGVDADEENQLCVPCAELQRARAARRLDANRAVEL